MYLIEMRCIGYITAKTNEHSGSEAEKPALSPPNEAKLNGDAIFFSPILWAKNCRVAELTGLGPYDLI